MFQRTDGHEIKNKVPCLENLKTLAENDKVCMHFDGLRI